MSFFKLFEYFMNHVKSFRLKSFELTWIVLNLILLILKFFSLLIFRNGKLKL